MTAETPTPPSWERPRTTPACARGVRWSDVTAEIAATLAKIDEATAEPKSTANFATNIATGEVSGEVSGEADATPDADNARILELADQLDEAGTPDETFVAAELRNALTGVVLAPSQPPPPLTYEQLADTLNQLGSVPPLEPIKLTREQLAALPRAKPDPFGSQVNALFGTPVELVDTVEESTPYRMAMAKPGPLIVPTRPLADAEAAELERRFTEAMRGPQKLVQVVTPTVTPIQPEPDIRPGWLSRSILARVLRRIFR